MKYEGTEIVHEIGDWVTRGDETVMITRLCSDGFEYEPREGAEKILYRSSWYKNSHPATQEEINKATQEEKIMVGEYEVKFVSENHLHIGCVDVEKGLFLKIGKKARWL